MQLSIIFAPFLVLLIFTAGCSSKPNAVKEIPSFLLKFPPDSFAYPIGDKEYSTERNDVWDKWYNAQDFGDNRHLGEDWNANTGGNTDCGEAVFATADGLITFAGDAGPGWGNTLIIDHTAADGTKVQSLYGHLNTLDRTNGEVMRRGQIGTIGSANGRYLCHLHFEIRWEASRFWNMSGPGYADDKTGWIDPSEFIDRQRANSR